MGDRLGIPGAVGFSPFLFLSFPFGLPSSPSAASGPPPQPCPTRLHSSPTCPHPTTGHAWRARPARHTPHATRHTRTATRNPGPLRVPGAQPGAHSTALPPPSPSERERPHPIPGCGLGGGVQGGGRSGGGASGGGGGGGGWRESGPGERNRGSPGRAVTPPLQPCAPWVLGLLPASGSSPLPSP